MNGKKWKKFLSMILAICMIMNMFVSLNPLEAFADGYAELKFSASSLEHGKVFYQIGDEAKIEITADQADDGGAVWVRNIPVSEQNVKIIGEPEEGYNAFINVFEGEGSTSTAYGGSFDENANAYTFPLGMNTYVVEVSFTEENVNPNPDPGYSTASLKFTTSDLADLEFTYTISLPENASKPESDTTPYGIETTVDGGQDENGAVWIKDFVTNSNVVIKVKLKEGVSGTLQEKIENIYATEGDENGAPVAYDGFFSFNSDNTVGTYTFSASQAKAYAVGVSYKGGPGPGPGPGPEPGVTRPENYGEAGYISLDTHDCTDGKVYYTFADSLTGTESWTLLSSDEFYYEPVDMSAAGDATKVYFKFRGANGKHMDVDGGLRLIKEVSGNRIPLYSINGSFNDDPNYDAEKEGAQFDRIGLNDLYDTVKDEYVVAFELASISTEPIHMEFKWIEVQSITVEVDDASQYLLTSGKVNIGIATGKGFSTSVEDGYNVSIPILEDVDLEGQQERYLIELKVNRAYFVPYFSFNGQEFETFSTPDGNDVYTCVATAVPASTMKSLLNKVQNKLVIHLTVNKEVSVNGGGENSPLSAEYNMIDDGKVPSQGNIENLDVDVALRAKEVGLTDSNKTAGVTQAYDINMQVNGTSKTEFDVPIEIRVPGDYKEGVSYSVIREHAGEAAQTLSGTIKNGELVFNTSKFSKFSIKHTHKGSSETTKATLTKNGKIVTTCVVCGFKMNTTTVAYPKTFKLSKTTYTYNGKVQTPTVTVYNSNKAKLKLNTDYTLSYSKGRKNVGQYTVTIKMKGKYSGTKRLTYTIVSKGTSISALSALSKGFKVAWKKQSSMTSGYQVQYSTSGKFSSAKTVTVSRTSTVKKSITKLKGKKKYYVRVRTYRKVGSKKYYSSWSKVKKVTTKK